MNWDRSFRCGVAVVIGIALGSVGSSANTDGMADYFDLDIRVEKQVFLLGEPIWIDVQLAFTGQDTLLLAFDPLCLGCGTLDVVVKSGDRVFPYTGVVAFWLPVPRKVAPGETITMEFDLLAQFGEPVKGTRLMEKELPVGSYDVWIHELGVSSGTLSFTIVEPSGQDAVIHRTMHDAIAMAVRHLRLDAATMLEELLPTIGDSPYREKLLFLLTRVWYTNKIEYMDACRRIIDDDPDSRYARAAVNRLMWHMSVMEAEELRNDIRRHAPESRAAKAVAEALAKGWFAE
jgi:hypothetical protein